MAGLPVFMRKLFGNEGAGPKLRSDIIPEATDADVGGVKKGDVVLTSAQTLTSDQKSQVQTNIDAVSESELMTALSELITEFGGTVPSD